MEAHGIGNSPAPSTPRNRRDSERVPVMRPCSYEMSETITDDIVVFHRGAAVCVNMSTGGMLLLMPDPPQIQQVFSVHPPNGGSAQQTTRPVEARWVRPSSGSSGEDTEQMYLVGVKFLMP